MARGPFVVMKQEKPKSTFLLLNAGLPFCYKSNIFTVVLECSNNLCTLNHVYGVCPIGAGGAHLALQGVILKGCTG